MCIAYTLLLEFLGYLPSTLLLMVFLFWGIYPHPWWVIITGGVGSAILSYLLFHVLLKIDLPIGFLGI